jgi:hypothetical protein
MAKLIITNGEAAAERMREAGLKHDILCWRDILHEGPAPETPTLGELSVIRAQFLAARGWSEEQELITAFVQRDAVIRSHQRYNSVVVWMEHDLYSQLQLMQILDFLAREPPRDGLYLIQAGQHLARETPVALKRHLRLMEPATRAHLDLAQLAWKSFRAATPEPLAALLQLDTQIFPFLKMAVMRHLEELPAPRTGLTHTEYSIMMFITRGCLRPRELYAHFTEEEAAVAMGNWSFWHILDQLGMGHSPLVTGFNGHSFSPQLGDEELEPYLCAELSLTNLGQNALKGLADAAVHRRIDRWMGGVHLSNNKLWRWDPEARQLIAP